MKNKMYQGIIVGTIFPIIFGLLVKFIFFDYIPFSNLVDFPKLASPFLQYGIIANLLIFFIYKMKFKEEEQRGIVLPTLVYAFLAMLLKFYF